MAVEYESITGRIATEFCSSIKTSKYTYRELRTGAKSVVYDCLAYGVVSKVGATETSLLERLSFAANVCMQRELEAQIGRDIHGQAGGKAYTE